MSVETMSVDLYYSELLRLIFYHGHDVLTRNSSCRSHVGLPSITFSELPLVTLRKTAWRMAVKEMEWFLSGNPRCPADLLPWWEGQLNPQNEYREGYSVQFRDSPSEFDQIEYLLDGLRHNPYSRRLILTAWAPYEMAHITQINDNLQTPTTCHSTLVQCFVRKGQLFMTSYQRSADMLLGVPHNWVQSWALLLYLAKHANLRPGTLRWIFGDAHIYWHPSHTETARLLMEAEPAFHSLSMLYHADPVEKGVPVFKTTDFEVIGDIPEPRVITKPVRL